jgi:hypothetical protein
VQADEQFIEGRPRTILRRRIAIVPLQAGALSLPGPRIEWWDAAQGVARTAMLPPLQLQVAAGASAQVVAPSPLAEPGDAAGAPASELASAWKPVLPWLLGVVALVGAFAWWHARKKRVPAGLAAATVARAPSLVAALKRGELGAIAHALGVLAGVRGDDLDAVRARLEDPSQVAAIEALQAARWGDGDAPAALASLRRAFAKGPRWRTPQRKPGTLLPPLYPE